MRIEPASPLPPQLRRRQVIASVVALLLSPDALAAQPAPDLVRELAAIRTRIGGRLGVHALDTHSGRRISFDDDSRYAMASTFKVLLAAAVLELIDRRRIDPERRVAFGQSDMLSHAPVTSQNLARGWMSVRELCAAAVETSRLLKKSFPGLFQRRLRKAWFSLRSRNQAHKTVHDFAGPSVVRH